jgi:hypothetical protein
MLDFSKPKMLKVPSPPLMVLYGPPGIGKTSFAIGADSSSKYTVGKENHLLVNVDFRGADRLVCNRATDSLGRPISSSGDIDLIFKTLAEQDHNITWVIFDDLSSLEELYVEEVCSENNVTEIGRVEYGRGYELARQKWYHLFLLIKDLQEIKPIGFILIGHTKIDTLKDPMSESYSRHDLQLDKRSKEIIKAKVELIGFAHKKVMTKENKAAFGKKEVTVVGESTRVLTFSPDIEKFESKDRFKLPEEMLLDWSTFIDELDKSMKKDYSVEKTSAKKQSK